MASGPRFLPWSLVPGSFRQEGVSQSYYRSYPSPVTGPARGYPQDKGTPSPWPELGYPLSSQDWGTLPPVQVTLRAVRLVRFPAGGLSCSEVFHLHMMLMMPVRHCFYTLFSFLCCSMSPIPSGILHNAVGHNSVP